MKNRFENKIAIVTGSGQGIGRNVALDIANEGGSVVVTDIDEKLVAKVVEEIIQCGNKAIGITCDISNKEQVEMLIDKTVEAYGVPDILVNNAGLLIPGTIEETTDKIIDDTLDVNVKGILYAIRKLTPLLKEKGYGRIVNVSSITGKNGDNSTVFVYGASKGAVISLTRSVARQLGPFGVTCNGVAPHAIMTKLMSYWDDEKKNAIAEKIPVKRLGTPEDVASLIEFLASDQASFINGETVNVNGGYYMD